VRVRHEQRPDARGESAHDASGVQHYQRYETADHGTKHDSFAKPRVLAFGEFSLLAKQNRRKLRRAEHKKRPDLFHAPERGPPNDRYVDC
jgi:hypothetical protein